MVGVVFCEGEEEGDKAASEGERREVVSDEGFESECDFGGEWNGGLVGLIDCDGWSWRDG